MPFPLDPSLPPSLYPVAWLMGSWSGHGAVTLPDAEGGILSHRIEQTLTCAAAEGGTMSWQMRTEMIDAPAPLPPTSVFVNAEESAPEPPAGSGERTLLLRERGTWRIGEPLPGQDLEAARRAQPGDPAGVLSYAVAATIDSGSGPVEWAGEIRGPRIRLIQAPDQETLTGTVHAERMFGYVGGRLMWLWERGGANRDPRELAPYISVELDRHELGVTVEDPSGGADGEGSGEARA